MIGDELSGLGRVVFAVVAVVGFVLVRQTDIEAEMLADTVEVGDERFETTDEVDEATAAPVVEELVLVAVVSG